MNARKYNSSLTDFIYVYELFIFVREIRIETSQRKEKKDQTLQNGD
jgi:hypothetical protein